MFEVLVWCDCFGWWVGRWVGWEFGWDVWGDKVIERVGNGDGRWSVGLEFEVD